MALRLMDTLTCSPVVHWIPKNPVATHWSGPPSETLSDLRVRFHLNRFHPTFVSTLDLFPEPSLKLQEWQI